MRIHHIVPLLLLAPAVAFAQNWSHAVQIGDDNFQVTDQHGRNLSITAQIGDDNDAATAQSGTGNASVIVQSGDGLSQTNVQSGDYQIYSSTQVKSALPVTPVSRTTTVSGAVGSITVHFSVE